MELQVKEIGYDVSTETTQYDIMKYLLKDIGIEYSSGRIINGKFKDCNSIMIDDWDKNIRIRLIFDKDDKLIAYRKTLDFFNNTEEYGGSEYYGQENDEVFHIK